MESGKALPKHDGMTQWYSDFLWNDEFCEIPKKKKRYAAYGETNNKKNQKSIKQALQVKRSAIMD
jgi:hypothetical protein